MDFMPEERCKRRLAAILAADVVGYSGLMEQDEAGTLAALKTRQKDVLEPLIARYEGRIFKLTGDGILAEFGSAVEAVECAIALQHDMATASAGPPGDLRIVLRIGVNLGDVIVEGSDLYGEGINIAARLEGIADPGGIALSGTTYEHVRNKIKASFEDLGVRPLKNIAEPVRVYRVNSTPGAPIAMRISTAAKPSIAVLPFVNMSGDSEQQYFSDGITEDIITELTRFRQLFVIARNSSFAFRDRPIDVTEVGRKLGVQYVVEGSVRKSVDRVRVTAQLVDSATGNHLWAERYDRNLKDIFAVQDDITQNIVAALFGRIEDAGAQRAKRQRPENHAVYDYLLRGIEFQQRQTREDLGRARAMLQKAIEIDPDCAAAYAYLALVDQGEWDFDGSPALLDRAIQNAQRAVSLDEDDALCHVIMGYVYLWAKQLDEAEFHQLRAMTLNPNYAHILAHMGLLSAYLGRARDAIGWLNKALRLNPYPPDWYRSFLGMAQYVAHDYADAVASLNPMMGHFPWDRMYLAASYAQLNRFAEARAQLAECRDLRPQGSLLVYASNEPFRNQADLEHLIEGLHKAGLRG
ncbi:MAG TPA: adenylate/guanylate cyclase domain-containing protein [Alphaproteobacteria bacterium]|nr:adenylate/guanylate cyclase domain-containing protein [Alphaproteobacteria bacterium]